MSTKIYNGFKLRSGTDMFTFRENFNEKFLESTKKSINQEAVNLIIRYYDLLTFNNGQLAGTVKKTFDDLNYHKQGTEFKFGHLFYAAEEHIEKMNKLSGRGTGSHPENIQLIINRNPRNGSILGYFYGSDKNYRKFLKMDEVESEYSYYNNTDKPRNITEEKWDERGTDWDETFNLDLPFANQGIHFLLLSEYDEMINRSDMGNKKYTMPTHAARVKFLTEKYLSDELKPSFENTTLGEYEDYVDNEENVARVKTIVEELIKPLPKWANFTKIVIANPYPKIVEED